MAEPKVVVDLTPEQLVYLTSMIRSHQVSYADPAVGARDYSSILPRESKIRELYLELLGRIEE